MLAAELDSTVEGGAGILDAAAGKVATSLLIADEWFVETSGSFFDDALLDSLVAVKVGELEAHEAGGARGNFLGNRLVNHGFGFIESPQAHVGIGEILVGVIFFRFQPHGL